MASDALVFYRDGTSPTQEWSTKLSHTENSTIAAIRDHKLVGEWLGERLAGSPVYVPSPDDTAQVEETVQLVAVEMYEHGALGIEQHLRALGRESSQLSGLREVVRGIIVENRELAPTSA